MAELSYFIEKRKRLLDDYNTMEVKWKDEKIKKLKSFLDENNTEEEFIIEYLKLELTNQQLSYYKNEIYTQNKEKDFILELEKYEIGVNKKTFNDNFGNYFLKQSAY